MRGALLWGDRQARGDRGDDVGAHAADLLANVAEHPGDQGGADEVIRRGRVEAADRGIDQRLGRIDDGEHRLDDLAEVLRPAGVQGLAIKYVCQLAGMCQRSPRLGQLLRKAGDRGEAVQRRVGVGAEADEALARGAVAARLLAEHAVERAALGREMVHGAHHQLEMREPRFAEAGGPELSVIGRDQDRAENHGAAEDDRKGRPEPVAQTMALRHHVTGTRFDARLASIATPSSRRTHRVRPAPATASSKALWGLP